MIWWQGHRGHRRNSPSNVPPIAGMAAVELLVQPRSFPGISTSVGCDFREVWDANLKCGNMLKYVEMLHYVIQEGIHWYPWYISWASASSLFILSFCIPRHWAPQPRNYHPGQGPRRGRQRDGSTSSMNRLGLSVYPGRFFELKMVKWFQVVKHGQTWLNIGRAKLVAAKCRWQTSPTWWQSSSSYHLRLRVKWTKHIQTQFCNFTSLDESPNWTPVSRQPN